MNLLITEKPKFDPKWWSLLAHHFGSSGIIEDVYRKLIYLKNQKTLIYPSSSTIYKQFRDCKYDDITVCFLSPEPVISYKQSKFWQYLSMLIELETYDGLNLNFEDNMDYLLPQGVIHLSPSLTVGKSVNHNTLGWQPFVKDVIHHLSNSLNSIMFVYEDSTLEFLEGVNFNKHKVELLQSGCIKAVNKFIQENYNYKIKW